MKHHEDVEQLRTMQAGPAERTGRWGFKRLAAFQGEGYADYVAFARPVDLRRGRADLEGTPAT